MNVYIGGPVVISDMQGPCPDGFHVPLSSEWQAIFDAGVSLGAWGSSGGTNFSTYLKIPMAGRRNYSDLSFIYRGEYGYYWSSSPYLIGRGQYDVNNSYGLSLATSDLSYGAIIARSYGCQVRGLKNTPVVPTSSWTILYQGSGSAGIFHNPTDGLISISSDGTTWYTLMDKNLGATTVYNYGDTLTEANCGKVYQRGNNYGFSGDENYDVSQISQSSTQVNVTGYGPGNYYESSTWITNSPRQSSANYGTNLRGGVSKGTSTKSGEVKSIYLGEGTTTVLSDMQGPCPDGFHVPLSTEWQAIYDAGTSLGAWNSSGSNNFSTYLKIPKAGSRPYYNASPFAVGSDGYYWSSSNYNNDYNNAWILGVYSSAIYPRTDKGKGNGYPIRGLKNTPVTPTSSRTVLYQGTGSAGIYWNSIDGLISISADGTTWYTLMDKNLGATTVYNYGDTLTDANCGNVFQWGNNYAFPGALSSDSITTSGTQVNASTYGPGNYYSSNKFIIGNNDWDSSLSTNLRGGTSQGSSTKVNPGIKEVYIGTTKVYPAVKPDYLCFTSNQANSYIELRNDVGTPTTVTLETSTDGNTWSTYSINSRIILNIGDKVYFRNTSETDTGFSIDGNNYYKFTISGNILASGDINTLLNKRSTTKLSQSCFTHLFYGCTGLKTPPRLPATTLANDCYSYMFYGSGIYSLVELPATTLTGWCYQRMFYGCTYIKLSETKAGAYQTAYRIPTTGTGTTANFALDSMFSETRGSWVGTPSINTTYYTSNAVV